MPIVTVELLEGRSIEQKRKLVEGITEALVNIGASREAVRIIIRDIPKYNFARAGVLASEQTQDK